MSPLRFGLSKVCIGDFDVAEIEGRSFWFDAEIVMSSWIETSVFSDIPAVIADFRVLVGFQTLQCMIRS
jgi:hypothetical protein